MRITYSIAPAASAALGQATALWPHRSRASDGLLGDQAHRQRKSWHNPVDKNGNFKNGGVVCAFDLTHDPANGCDAHALVRAAVERGDQRISEAISQGRIWTRARASEGWREYDGENRHDHHAHVTVAWEHRTDTSPWWVTSAPVNIPRPRPVSQEADVTKDEVREVVQDELAKLYGEPVDKDKTHVSMADLNGKLNKIMVKIGLTP